MQVMRFIEWLKSLFRKAVIREEIRDYVAASKPPKIEQGLLDKADESMHNRLMPYRWAQKELGVQEVAGKGSNPRIIYYHAFTSLKATDDSTPWCSAFMNAAAMSTGFTGTKSAAASSWLEYGIEGDGSVGDIAVFKREGGHHVAFVNKAFTGQAQIEVLGGNQRDRVGIDNYGVSNLLAFRRFKT